MALAAQDLCISAEDYLKCEETSDVRHEYVAGRMFAMVGATDAHNIITGNLYRYLYDAVTASGCRAYMADMKVWIEESQSFYYPDIMITCEPIQPKSVYKSTPSLIIEVLSPSTKIIDQREKLTAYRLLPSLKEYLLVSQERIKVEIYRKDASGKWHCTIAQGHDAKVQLNAVPGTTIQLEMHQIYRSLSLSS
jgi:Uma2 family endonuclease